jgi:hypothetical protein
MILGQKRRYPTLKPLIMTVLLAGAGRLQGRLASMKKLLILVVVVLLGGFAVWRKVQAQRADLDLWSEATASDD